jgi:murein L,D-transpeptidase YafK
MFSALQGEPSIVIWKSQYSLTLYKGNTPVKTYHAVFGRGYADGDKQQTGDRRTPEGEFYVCSMNHSKRFYKFLGLSYPSLKHAEQGVRKGSISPAEYDAIARALATGAQPSWDTRLGGAIGIHGRMLEDPVAQASRQNWTDGCIALLNSDVDELFGAVRVGTPVTILP